RQSTNARGDVTVIETLVPRITTADFDLVNRSRGLAFVTINGQSGFACFSHPFICRVAGFTCTGEEYQRFLSLPWPELPNTVDESDFAADDFELTPPLKTTEERSAAAAIALAALAAHHPKH